MGICASLPRPHPLLPIVVGGVGIGSVLIWQLFQRKLAERQLQRKEMAKKRLKLFLATDGLYYDCVHGMLMQLLRRIFTKLDTSRFLNDLLHSSSIGLTVQIWKDINVVCVARLISFLHCCSMLSLLLRVQLSLLAGVVFKELDMDERFRVPVAVKKEFMQLLNNFLSGRAFDELLDLILAKVREAIVRWPLTTRLTSAQIGRLFATLELATAFDPHDPNSRIIHHLMKAQSQVVDSFGFYGEAFHWLGSNMAEEIHANNMRAGFMLTVDAIMSAASETLGEIERLEREESAGGDQPDRIPNLENLTLCVNCFFVTIGAIVPALGDMITDGVCDSTDATRKSFIRNVFQQHSDFAARIYQYHSAF